MIFRLIALAAAGLGTVFGGLTFRVIERDGLGGETSAGSFQCQVSRNLPGGLISATRSLDNDGNPTSDDRFTWSSFAKDQAAVYVTWDGIDVRERALGGTIRVDLPGLSNGQYEIVFARSGQRGRLSAIRRYTGPSQGPLDNSIAMSLGDVIAYADGAKTLDWRYESPSAQAKFDRSGTIALASLDEALRARRTMARELAVAARNFRTACGGQEKFGVIDA